MPSMWRIGLNARYIAGIHKTSELSGTTPMRYISQDDFGTYPRVRIIDSRICPTIE